MAISVFEVLFINDRKKRRSPLIMDIFNDNIMANVTAGFMCAPPKSPKVHAVVVTIKPIPRPVMTASEKPLSLPQVKGSTHCMDTSI